MKDAQDLLHKVDSDLNQKYNPDFKDQYQIELLLRELDVSDGPSQGLPHPSLQLPPGGVGGLTWALPLLHSGPGEGSGQVRACGAGPAEARPAGCAPQVPPGDPAQAHPRGGAL